MNPADVPETIRPSSALARAGLEGLPAIIASAGEHGARRFVEFFNIRNKNTRRAYVHAVKLFLGWLEARGVHELGRVEPMMVAAYLEKLGEDLAKPSVKQHLAAIRMLFDWLVTGGVLPFNPASSVRGPRFSARRGKTPVLDDDQVQQLLDSIDTSKPVGLRDRALIAVMAYDFARVGAVVGTTRLYDRSDDPITLDEIERQLPQRGLNREHPPVACKCCRKTAAAHPRVR